MKRFLTVTIKILLYVFFGLIILSTILDIQWLLTILFLGLFIVSVILPAIIISWMVKYYEGNKNVINWIPILVFIVLEIVFVYSWYKFKIDIQGLVKFNILWTIVERCLVQFFYNKATEIFCKAKTRWFMLQKFSARQTLAILC